jgi:3',5'-nucleoside bisphosphate phosphatase
MLVRAELHVHTVLSPCAGVEMIPPVIVARAVELGLDCIAITDHNASANAAAVMQAAQGARLHVLPGMELQTREDVHLLCLFDTCEQADAWQQIVDANLPDLSNDADAFGEQFVVDATGDLLRCEDRMLVVATRLSLEQAMTQVQALGGLAIPAHVDRLAYGLLPALGFIPPDLAIEALEISTRQTPAEIIARFPQLARYPLLIGGDVHYPDNFLGANFFEVDHPSIAEFRLAFSETDGRRLTIGSKDGQQTG